MVGRHQGNIVLIAVALSAAMAEAQGTSQPSRVATPAEYSAGVDLYARLLTPASSDQEQPERLPAGPSDAATTVAVARVRAWVQGLQQQKITGIQLDPQGRLLVLADQDTHAQALFAERLATPGLTVDERAYTLLMALWAFVQPSDSTRRPERMRVAETYLTQLDALPTAMNMWKYRAHDTMARVAYMRGNSALVIHHALEAFRLVPTLPFRYRFPVYKEKLFVLLADALSGTPNGRARIDSVGAVLLALATPDPALVANDSRWTIVSWPQDFAKELHLTAYLGKPAPPILGMHWFNTSTPAEASSAAPDARMKPMNDGVIRLLEFGEYSCGACKDALPMMGRLQRAAIPNTEVWYVTNTEGAWGKDLVDPADEARYLKQYYVTRRQLNFPIALWAGPKDSTADGGLLPSENPSITAYPIKETPTFVIVDGHGIVRHISVGFFKDLEPLLAAKLRFLSEERRQQATTVHVTTLPS